MLVRLLLACWMFVTSALGPALCCCVPLPLPPAAQPASLPAARCQHCPAPPVSVSSSKAERPTPHDRCPCGHAPGQKGCPCRDHHRTPVIMERADAEAATLFAWASDFALPVAPPAGFIPVGLTPVRTVHTGPPPVAGVELLRRLHVLVC